MGTLRKLSAFQQSAFYTSHVSGVALTHKHLQTRVIGELKFDSMTAAAGTGLRWSDQIHLTNTRKNIRQVRPSTLKHISI